MRSFARSLRNAGRPRARHHDAGRRHRLAPGGHPNPVGEHVVVRRLDPIQDLRVEHPGRPDASGRPRRQQRDSGVGEAVERTIAFDLVRQELLELRCRPALLEVHPEAPQIILRHVDPGAVQILVDVAQEVGQLEGQTERAGGCLGGRAGRLEHRQHHLPDHRRRTLHVVAEVLPGLVRGPGQVHRHGAEEAVEALRLDAAGDHRVHDGRHGGVLGVPFDQGGAEPIGEGLQPPRRAGGVRTVPVC